MMPLRATKRRREYVGAFVHETVGAGVSLLLPAKADDASAASTNPAPKNLILDNDKVTPINRWLKASPLL
jgi:hypothetical protein